MMNQHVFLLTFLLLFAWNGMSAQVRELEENSKVYLVLMDLESQSDIAMCYSKRFDKKFVPIEYAYEDTINYLDDYVYLEEPLTGPECFVPEIKLVFKYHTYIISLFCSKVIKYRNQTPWITSPQRVRNDLFITPSVYDYLNRLRVTHFGEEALNSGLLKNVVVGESLDDMYDDAAELELLLQEEFLEEDDEDDLKIETPVIIPDEEDPIEDEEWEDDEG